MGLVLFVIISQINNFKYNILITNVVDIITYKLNEQYIFRFPSIKIS